MNEVIDYPPILLIHFEIYFNFHQLDNYFLNINFTMSEVLSTNVQGGALAYISGSHRFPHLLSQNGLHQKTPRCHHEWSSSPSFSSRPRNLTIEFSSTRWRGSHRGIFLLRKAKIKEIEVQTDYRESEVQTDPYSPEEIYREGEKPEVLFLKNLTYGHGLPATIDVLDMI